MAVKLLSASKPATILHCVTGWYQPCVISSSRDQRSFTGVPGTSLAIRTRVAKKLKLQERRAVIPSRRSLAACRPLGFLGRSRAPSRIGGHTRGLMEWARILAYITGTVDHELLLRNEYLAAENRILRGQLKGRLKLSDAERAKLGEIG